MPRLQITSLVAVTLLAGGSGVLAQDTGQTQMLSVMQVPLEKSRQAIIECREKRLRGEISTYAESARCSNPQIFEAWKAANYPHMDLITEWLNAREAASDKVDQRIITPEEFERQMDELTVRLTAEEQRRRAGFLSSADNTLQLQLPPPPQPVATPAGAPKSAGKKNNAAARAPAVSQYADPAQGTAVGSVGALSQLDPPKQPVRVAGLSVPPPPNTPAARTVPARTETSGGSNNVYALLSSQQKEVDARAIYRMLQEKYPDILGKHNAVIRRADISGQGSYYRVEVGPLTSGQADQLCGSLKQVGAQCTQHYE
ncbi:MAG: hypothetical protein WB760_22200 [Xanthobacteraceae bacterium]